MIYDYIRAALSISKEQNYQFTLPEEVINEFKLQDFTRC